MTHSMRDAEIKDFKAEKMYKAVLDRSFNVFNNTTNYQSKEVPSRQLHFRAQIPTQQSVMKDIFIRLPTRFRFYNASGRRISPYNVALADSGLDRIFKTVMMLINGRSYTIQPETVMFESTLYKPKTESSRDSGNYQPIAKLSRHNMNKCAEINYGFVERARDFRRNIGFEEDEKVDTRQEYYDYDVLIPLNIGLQSNFYRENLNCSDSLPFAYELELILHFNNEVSSADAEKHKPLGIEGQACWKNVLQIGNSLCELVVEDETPNDHHNDLHIGTNHYIELGGQVVTPDHADAANLHGSDGLADRAGVAGWQVIVIPVDDKDMGANAVFDVPNNNANTTALKSILVPTYALGNGLGAMGDRFSNHVGCPGVKPILYIENGTNDDFAALPAVNGFTKFEIEGVDRVGRHITVDRDVGMNVAGSNIYILNPIYVIDRGAGRNKADHKDHSKKIIVHVADMCRDGTVEEIVDNLIGLMCALQDRMEDEENNTPCYTIPEGSSKGFVKRLIKTIWMNHKHEFTIAQIRIQIGSNDRIDTPHKVTKTLRTMLKDRKIKWGRAKTVIESYRFELQDRNDKQKVQELGVTILEKHECNPDSQDRIKFSLGDRPMAHFTDGTTTVEKVLELLHFYVKEIENGTIFTNDMVD